MILTWKEDVGRLDKTQWKILIMILLPGAHTERISLLHYLNVLDMKI